MGIGLKNDEMDTKFVHCISEIHVCIFSIKEYTLDNDL